MTAAGTRRQAPDCTLRGESLPVIKQHIMYFASDDLGISCVAEDWGEKTKAAGSGNIALVIQEGTQCIYPMAFCRNRTGYYNRITDAAIPDSVTCIGTNAFRDCINLQCVVFGAGVKDISSSAFLGCSSLKMLDMRKCRITRIPPYMCSRCTGLEEVLLPDSVEEICTEAFAYCDNLHTIYLPRSARIDSAAFKKSVNSNVKRVRRVYYDKADKPAVFTAKYYDTDKARVSPATDKAFFIDMPIKHPTEEHIIRVIKAARVPISAHDKKLMLSGAGNVFSFYVQDKHGQTETSVLARLVLSDKEYKILQQAVKCAVYNKTGAECQL